MKGMCKGWVDEDGAKEYSEDDNTIAPLKADARRRVASVQRSRSSSVAWSARICSLCKMGNMCPFDGQSLKMARHRVRIIFCVAARFVALRNTDNAHRRDDEY